jgi:hypothetical protein
VPIDWPEAPELGAGKLGAEIFLRPVDRPRNHISVGVELDDGAPVKDGAKQAREDGAMGGDSDRAVAVFHHREAAREVDRDRLSSVEIGGGPDEWPGPEDLAVAEIRRDLGGEAGRVFYSRPWKSSGAPGSRSRDSDVTAQWRSAPASPPMDGSLGMQTTAEADARSIADALREYGAAVVAGDNDNWLVNLSDRGLDYTVLLGALQVCLNLHWIASVQVVMSDHTYLMKGART